MKMKFQKQDKTLSSQSQSRFIIQMRIDHHHNKYNQNWYLHPDWNLTIQIKCDPQGDISWDE